MFDQGTATATDDSNETTAPAWLKLHREMKSATRRRSAWDAEHARHLREAEAQQLWNHFGYISILEYLEREHGIEPRTASDRLRVSHALADLPLLEAELEEGSFQYSHVKELTRIVTPETEDEWIAAARGKTCGEVQAMVAGRKKGDGPEDPDDPDLRLRRLILALPPQTLAMYREQIAALEAELGHRLEEAEGFRMIEGRAPDALRFEWVRVDEEQRAHVGTNERQAGAASRFTESVLRSQARDALVGLGWKPGIARGAVDEACAHVGIDVAIDVLIREALRRCPKPLA